MLTSKTRLARLQTTEELDKVLISTGFNYIVHYITDSEKCRYVDIDSHYPVIATFSNGKIKDRSGYLNEIRNFVDKNRQDKQELNRLYGAITSGSSITAYLQAVDKLQQSLNHGHYR